MKEVSVINNAIQLINIRYRNRDLVSLSGQTKRAERIPQTKHWQLSWTFLPDIGKLVFEDYISLKPKGSEYFFVYENGKPVTRWEFDNYLDSCNLNTFPKSRLKRIYIKGFLCSCLPTLSLFVTIAQSVLKAILYVCIYVQFFI